MTENECMYLKGKIGQHIDEDFMVRGDDELRYRPFGHFETSAPVADVLDITDDVLLGAPKHPHPAPKTSPEIKKTLHWIQNTLNDEEGKALYESKDGKADVRINLMPELRGCQVTFVYATRSDWKEESHTRHQVNLGGLDPTSLKVDPVTHDIIGPVSIVTVFTTDKEPSISLAANDRAWEPANVIPTTDLLWELPSPYAERFVKALRQAITLCGGKSSSF